MLGEGSKELESDKSESRTDLLGYALNELASTSVSRQFHDFSTFEFLNQRQELFAALTAAIEGEKLKAKESFEDKRSFDDLMFAEDLEFVETFRLTRKTVRFIVADLKGSGYQPMVVAHGGGCVEKWLLLTLWYLGNKKHMLDRAATTFGLEGGRAEVAVTDVCLALATQLPKLAGLSWPSDPEIADIEMNMIRRYNFPRLVGLLGFFVFVTELPVRATEDDAATDSGKKRQSTIALQAVIDDRQRFRDIHTTVVDSSGQDTARQVLVRSSLYARVVEPRKDRRHVLAGSVYPQTGCLLTPFVDDGHLLEDERLFNRLHLRIMESELQDTIVRLVGRFPKLGDLELPPDACVIVIRAACVLHNYCQKYHDMAPIV